jgi:hypothetical protein
MSVSDNADRFRASETMEINTNLSTTGVNGAVAGQRSAPSPNMLSDRVSLTTSSALDQALQNTPASRPEMVARAQALIADPSYPSGDTLAAVSRQIAGGLLSENA